MGSRIEAETHYAARAHRGGCTKFGLRAEPATPGTQAIPEGD